MTDLWDYDKKKVKVITYDGRIYVGVCYAGTDYDTDEDYLDFYMKDEGTIHEVMQSEIESIEVIED